MSSSQHESAATSTASRSAAAAPAAAAGATASEGRKVSFQHTSAAPSRSSSAYLAPSSTSGGAGASASAGASAGGTSASSQAYSAHAGVTRRHSLFGTEDRIVLDIGSRYSKFGFSGEPRPRAIVPSVSYSQPSTSYLRFDTSAASDPYRVGDTLWDLDFERCVDDQLRRGKRALLLAQLTQLLRSAFTQHLMVDPKQRKVLVVENPMLPTSVREMICKVLFNNLQVPSVSFVTAPLMSLVAVGRITGLVLEIGYLESTLMPVYYGRPMVSYTLTSPRAGQRLNARLKRLLLQYGKFVAAQTGLQDAAKPLRDRTHSIDPAMLTHDRLEQIKAKALFVSSHDPILEGLQDLFHVLELESSDLHKVSQEVREEAVQTIRRKYSSASTATPFTFAISPESIDPHGTASLIQSISTPSSTSTSSMAGASPRTSASGVIAIPGWVRERAAELLFETGDTEELSLVDMAVTAIAKLPIVLRREMCETVLVSGGTAMLPGLVNRFRTQLAAAVEEAEQPGGELSFDRYVRRSKARKEGEERVKVDGLGLHRSVAVLNDPWPDLTQAQSSSSGGKKGGQGGSAPAFAANLLPWMGASLSGALKTTALSAISREAYDEAAKTVQDEAEAAQEAAGKENETDEAKEKEKEKGGSGAKASMGRPTMLGASKRGSFVGVVGGLETGAYGGLAAVSRHLVGVPGGAGSSSSAKSPTGAAETGPPPSAPPAP